ncbi:MAG: lactate racemase domain-containing protein [Spirochaetales bacterium]|nr:lactate racemase domain-containing protein [Spirochaetales bacterium]
MLYFEKGSPDSTLSDEELTEGLYSAFDKIGAMNKVLIIPPDMTRKQSKAGFLTTEASKYLGDKLKAILPALGTHSPMSASQIEEMYPGVDKNKFQIHNWRKNLSKIGKVPKDFIYDITDGALNFSWPIEINEELLNPKWDAILSIGQVVPHEVTGFSNHSKNIFVGVGGAEAIHKSHYIGAICGTEKIMGRADTPVRKVFNFACENYIKNIPIIYILTVIGADSSGTPVTKGLFIGDGLECFYKAAELSRKVNITILEKPIKKAVVYLNPKQYKSTWLGNKAIYRTRMAIEDNGELIIIAPGLSQFGEDPEIDKLIQKYGYCGTKQILKQTKNNNDLEKNLCAAAHLIHGSSEDRFSITYAAGKLSDEKMKKVGYDTVKLEEVLSFYNIDNLKNGFNIDRNGKEFYYINNPALGLWAQKSKFQGVE